MRACLYNTVALTKYIGATKTGVTCSNVCTYSTRNFDLQMGNIETNKCRLTRIVANIGHKKCVKLLLAGPKPQNAIAPHSIDK